MIHFVLSSMNAREQLKFRHSMWSRTKRILTRLLVYWIRHLWIVQILACFSAAQSSRISQIFCLIFSFTIDTCDYTPPIVIRLFLVKNICPIYSVVCLVKIGRASDALAQLSVVTAHLIKLEFYLKVEFCLWNGRLNTPPCLLSSLSAS